TYPAGRGNPCCFAEATCTGCAGGAGASAFGTALRPSQTCGTLLDSDGPASRAPTSIGIKLRRTDRDAPVEEGSNDTTNTAVRNDAQHSLTGCLITDSPDFLLVVERECHASGGRALRIDEDRVCSRCRYRECVDGAAPGPKILRRNQIDRRRAAPLGF